MDGNEHFRDDRNDELVLFSLESKVIYNRSEQWRRIVSETAQRFQMNSIRQIVKYEADSSRAMLGTDRSGAQVANQTSHWCVARANAF